MVLNTGFITSNKIIELQSRLELDKLNDDNSIMEIMRIAKLEDERNIHQ